MRKHRHKEINVALMIVSLILAFALISVVAIANRLERMIRLNVVLIEMVTYQAIRQAEMAGYIKIIADLTGVTTTAEKAGRGWYEALEENVGKGVPLVYPTGWADRYFNFLARTGTLDELSRGGRGGDE